MPRVRLQMACDERWDAMRRMPGGRFCERCEKRVVDFTRMTEREALIIASLFAPGALCGRLPNVRDGVPLFREEPRARSSRSFVPAMLVTAAMATGCSAPAAVATADPAAQSTKTAAKSPTADSDGDGTPTARISARTTPRIATASTTTTGAPTRTTTRTASSTPTTSVPTSRRPTTVSPTRTAAPIGAG